MTELGDRLARALGTDDVGTDPRAEDPRLRGRTWSVPFDAVWRAAMILAGGGLSGWRLASSDDLQGVIVATTHSRLAGTLRITIHIRLDDNGQTRVDARCHAEGRSRDFGAGVRRLVRFFDALDRVLAPSGSRSAFTA